MAWKRVLNFGCGIGKGQQAKGLKIQEGSNFCIAKFQTINHLEIKKYFKLEWLIIKIDSVLYSVFYSLWDPLIVN